jgi:hypothetical protein
MFQAQIRCDKCGWQGEFRSPRTYCYLLPDSRKLQMDEVGIGWCHTCNTVTEVECFGPADDYQRRLEYFQNKLGPGGSKYTDGPQILASVTTRLEWRSMRQSPPRCLRCAGTEIILWGKQQGISEFEDTPHPDCGGTIRETRRWRLRMWELEVLYTVEGKRIPSPKNQALAAGTTVMSRIRPFFPFLSED